MSAAICPECRQGKCPNCDGTAWDDDRDAEVRCEHDCRTPTEDDQPLFDGYEPPVLVEEERVSDDQRRTLRQARDIGNGVHPLTRYRLHEQASRDRDATSGKRDPFTCGSCQFRMIYTYRTKSYAKCVVEDGKFDTRSAASDVRAWWPACMKYQPVPGVSPLTSVGGG